jgi:hypothetical protein
LVVAGERSLLDLGLGGRAAQLPERAGVLERGDRAVAGERARVSADELARVERNLWVPTTRFRRCRVGGLRIVG